VYEQFIYQLHLQLLVLEDLTYKYKWSFKLYSNWY